MSNRRHVAFLFIGGVHHVSHTLPVAAALSLRRSVQVTALCADARVEQMVRQVLSDFPNASVEVERLRRFAFFDWLDRPSFAKLPMLWRDRRRIGGYDAIVTPEVTSIALRRMGVSRPLFICLPHGAGDRAVSFEPRFRRFDRVLVAGPKTERRMIEAGIAPKRLRQVGYPKAEYLAGKTTYLPRLFANDRPVVLYNPHFRTALSSLDKAEAIVRAIIDGTDLNLIVAPHIRAFEGASAKAVREWQKLAVPGRVLVDTGSPRLIDMSYVAAADIYLGDVSSQVYEFLLLRPRPCVFVNAHEVVWQDDPDYAFWNLGEVVSPDRVVTGLLHALQAPHALQRAQKAATSETFGSLQGSSERAADAILASIEEPR